MITVCIWIVVVGVVGLLAVFVWDVSDGEPLIAIPIYVVAAAAAYLLYSFAQAEAVSPTFTLKKSDWACTAEYIHEAPPTYVKSGNVMIPVGGGAIHTCTQYNSK